MHALIVTCDHRMMHRQEKDRRPSHSKGLSIDDLTECNHPMMCRQERPCPQSKDYQLTATCDGTVIKDVNFITPCLLR